MGASPLEETVLYAVMRAAKAYLRASGARLAAVGLQPGQDLLLSQLWVGDGLSQSELVKRLGVEPPTVTKALGRLEKAGLITRRRDQRDARLSRVYLTERGKRLRDPVRRIWADLEACGTRELSIEEQRLLRRLAGRIWESIEQEESRASSRRASAAPRPQ
jgi:MarR family transcriptional regulator, organic hydroperoxide resistance regulator